jgi:hypothetical protein
MFSRLGIAAALLAGLRTTGIGLAAYQPPREVEHTAPSVSKLDVARLSPAADLIYKYVKKHPGQFAWQRIPWLVDLPEAIRQSKAENRPVLLFVSGNDPLERC